MPSGFPRCGSMMISTPTPGCMHVGGQTPSRRLGPRSLHHFSLVLEWTSTPPTPPVRAMATCRALAASPWAGRIRCLVDRCLVRPVVQLGQLSFVRGGCRSHKFLESPFQSGVFDGRLVKPWTFSSQGQKEAVEFTWLVRPVLCQIF